MDVSELENFSWHFEDAFSLSELVSKEMVFTLVLIWMPPSFKGRISTLFFHTYDVFSFCPVITWPAQFFIYFVDVEYGTQNSISASKHSAIKLHSHLTTNCIKQY